ncbi:MAG TPA: LuxR family transcriptional regulator [Sphingomicrobium sp.]|nr:LuxR family transcriptional regulator [Sphingomicrobium sp.]
MGVEFERIAAFVDDVRAAAAVSELQSILAKISGELGFSHFALAHHVDLRRASTPAIRIHNYPAELEQYHDDQQLGSRDPVHRACQRTAIGFTWSELPRMVQLTPRDLRVLDAAARRGIGEGFTVPAHVPGELSGSCSFATASGVRLRADNLAMAQLVGAFAFQAARQFLRAITPNTAPSLHISDRERECLIWIARGKTDWEIGSILGISVETVRQYVKHARARFDVVSRSQLVAHALLAGTISFPEIAER